MKLEGPNTKRKPEIWANWIGNVRAYLGNIGPKSMLDSMEIDGLRGGGVFDFLDSVHLGLGVGCAPLLLLHQRSDIAGVVGGDGDAY